MQRSIQAVAYAMKVQSDRMNITANNVANIETMAYKKDVANVKSFDEVLAKAIDYNSGNAINTVGPLNLGSSIDEKNTIFEQGYIQQTGYSTDFAIRGDGFFTIETPDGIKYTRAGNFAINQDGALVTQDGDYVLGENGRINLPHRKLKVDMKGNISDIDTKENSIFIDNFRIPYFNDLSILAKDGHSKFINANQNNIKIDGQSDILQKFVESSNVNIVEETQDMTEAKRNFESCQQVIKMLDNIMGKATTEIGRI